MLNHLSAKKTKTVVLFSTDTQLHMNILPVSVSPSQTHMPILK